MNYSKPDQHPDQDYDRGPDPDQCEPEPKPDEKKIFLEKISREIRARQLNATVRTLQKQYKSGKR